MTATTKLYTFFHGRFVGNDQFGNRYYTEKLPPKGKRSKRWVLYNGIAEPSKVPPQWHGWLHYTTDAVPEPYRGPSHRWEKPHMPNLTGTKNAYVPSGHVLKGGKRASTSADYEAWKP